LNKNDRVHPTPNKKFKSRSKNPKGNTLDFTINIKAMLTAFYLGTGGLDIGGYASFFGLPGGRGWERSFHRNSPQVHAIVIAVATSIMEEAMIGEIKATIKEKLEGKYTEEEVDKAMDDFINEKWDDVPADILKIGITVSYDMGWNKRSTGKVYDSLSGHAFIIGCRTGNVIGMMVKKRNAAFAVNSTKTKIPHQKLRTIVRLILRELVERWRQQLLWN